MPGRSSSAASSEQPSRGRFGVLARAKANLHLRVLPPRPDGFHPLVTLFASLSLYDEVWVSPEPGASGWRLTVEEPAGPLFGGMGSVGGLPPGRNLVERAAAAWAVEAGAPLGGAVKLLKRTPAESGLGGGSADAAAMLLALDAVAASRAAARGQAGHAPQGPAPLGPRRLAAVARTLGADVPFMLSGGLALGQGVGDLLEPLPAPPPFGVVVLRPPGGVPTAKAYRELDLARGDMRVGAAGDTASGGADIDVADVADVAREIALAREVARCLADGRLAEAGRLAFNDFTAVAEALVPEVRRLREELIRAGARLALLSGSGSAVAGLFEDEAAARRALGPVRSACGSAAAFAWAGCLAPRGVSSVDEAGGLSVGLGEGLGEGPGTTGEPPRGRPRGTEGS